jgi:hypothetical protein
MALIVQTFGRCPRTLSIEFFFFLLVLFVLFVFFRFFFHLRRLITLCVFSTFPYESIHYSQGLAVQHSR